MVCGLRYGKDNNILTTQQLAKLTGLMMLLVASAVFLYYTIWTLFIVCSSPTNVLFSLSTANSVTAIRGRRPPTPRPFPSPRLGDSYSCDSHPRGHRCGRQLPERGYDQEWEEEGCEGEGEGGGAREEEELSTATFLVGRVGGEVEWMEKGRWHIVYVLGSGVWVLVQWEH